MRKILFVVLLLASFAGFGQSNFTYTPEKPKPGDLITITYTPAGDIANTMKPVEGQAHLFSVKGEENASDLAMTRAGSKYSFTFQTEPTSNFVFFGFSADNKFDNNFNNGYWIQLMEDGKPSKGSYSQLASFYQYAGSQVGVDRNNEKALDVLQKEFELYPDAKKDNMSLYVYLINQAKKDEAPALFQKEIEAILKAGLKDETDYSNIEMLYRSAKLPEQMKMFTTLKKEKFPNGKWTVNEVVSKYNREQDPVKKEEMLADILKKLETDKNWEYLKGNKGYFESGLANMYMSQKKWEEFKKAVYKISDKFTQAQMFNSAAWEMQKTSDNLKLAEEFSNFATQYTKSEWQKPTGTKPGYLTQKQWEKSRRSTYGMFADTYGMVMFKSGQYKKGFPYAKEAAIVIGEGKDADQNNTYALLAEKVLPAKQYKKEIEQFVKDGKSSLAMKEILERVWVKEKGSDKGFSDYLTALQKENIERMMAELRKSMLSETAPVFALNDLDGKKIDITELKGKVVIVDFWATWCGPCKASFPGMQKMVNKYKDNPNVKFIFVDTWENNVEDKKKNAGDFIASNKYSFHVLLDNDNKVVEQFKVEGIPTKFVLDKNGIIRFKSVGFGGSDDKLIEELTAMIDMASGDNGANTESKKAFK